MGKCYIISLPYCSVSVKFWELATSQRHTLFQLYPEQHVMNKVLWNLIFFIYKCYIAIFSLFKFRVCCYLSWRWDLCLEMACLFSVFLTFLVTIVSLFEAQGLFVSLSSHGWRSVGGVVAGCTVCIDEGSTLWISAPRGKELLARMGVLVSVCSRRYRRWTPNP